MRLIDAEALENEIVKTMRYVPKDAVLDVACMVNRAPTIEAKPIVHAHWNDDGRCTNCGEHAPFLLWADTWYESEYCHGCGAQMDEGVKIPVINMEDVAKLIEKELPSAEENPILRTIREIEKGERLKQAIKYLAKK